MKKKSFEKKLQQRFLLLPAAFFTPVILLHFALKMLRTGGWFIMHPFWPLSVFLPKLPILMDVITVIAIVGLFVGLWKIRKAKKLFLIKTMLIVGLIMIATNLLQGYQYGLSEPIYGRGEVGQSYLSDSEYIRDISDYLSSYSLYQPTMGYHARVHPPGAVLWFWLTRQVIDQPIFVGLMTMMVSLLSIGVIYTWSREYIAEKKSRYLAILFGLMPAFQIYGYASLDGVIAFLMIGCLWTFSKAKKWSWFLASIVLFYLVAMLTYGVLWLIPVIGYISWKVLKSWSLAIYSFAGVIFLLWLTNFLTGFNYWESFEVARSFENTTQGWYGFTDTPSYLVTRVQDVLEPIVFMGPYVFYLLVYSLYRFKMKHDLTGVAWVGLGSFIIFILAGAYYTGETARAALYLLPVMILAISPLLKQVKLSERMLRNILVAVLVQTVIMQMFGYYSW